MEKGSYTLILRLNEAAEVEIGSLGTLELRKGFYAYNGSANGSGGFKRLERHLEQRGKKHWHIDYINHSPKTGIVAFFKSPGADAECSVSQELSLEFEAVAGFGCSDCNCNSHLYYSDSRRELLEAVKGAYNGHADLTFLQE